MNKYVKKIKAAKMAIRRRIREMQTITREWQEGEDWHQFSPYKQETKHLPAKIVKGTWNVCRDYSVPFVSVKVKRPNGEYFTVTA